MATESAGQMQCPQHPPHCYHSNLNCIYTQRRLPVSFRNALCVLPELADQGPLTAPESLRSNFWQSKGLAGFRAATFLRRPEGLVGLVRTLQRIPTAVSALYSLIPYRSVLHFARNTKLFRDTRYACACVKPLNISI